MPFTPQIAALRISRQLKTAESQVDQTLLEYSKLMTELVSARQVDGVDAHAGQEVLIRLARAQVSIIDSSSDLFRAHDAAYKIGREMGLLEEKQANGLVEQTDGPATVTAQA
jgi:hypothetical protein